MRTGEPPRCAPIGAFLSRQSVAVDGRVPFISWQFNEMNQTTWPPRDPLGEQGNKCLVLKMWTFPRALSHRNNVMVEFPLQLFQTGKETRRFQDLTSPQILLVIPFFLLSRHGGKGISYYKTFGRVLLLVSVFWRGSKTPVTWQWLFRTTEFQLYHLQLPTQAKWLMSNFSSIRDSPVKLRLDVKNDILYLPHGALWWGSCIKGSEDTCLLMLTF